MTSQNKYLPRTGQSFLFACSLARAQQPRYSIGLPTEIFDRLPTSVNLIHNNDGTRRFSLISFHRCSFLILVSFNVKFYTCVDDCAKTFLWNENSEWKIRDKLLIRYSIRQRSGKILISFNLCMLIRFCSESTPYACNLKRNYVVLPISVSLLSRHVLIF